MGVVMSEWRMDRDGEPPSARRMKSLNVQERGGRDGEEKKDIMGHVHRHIRRHRKQASRYKTRSHARKTDTPRTSLCPSRQGSVCLPAQQTKHPQPLLLLTSHYYHPLTAARTGCCVAQPEVPMAHPSYRAAAHQARRHRGNQGRAEVGVR